MSPALAADRSMNSPRAWGVDAAACVLAGVLLGVVGPFGSFFNDALPVRVGYWVAVLLVSGLAYAGTLRWLAPRARAAGVPLWIWAGALVLALTLPLTFVTRFIARLVWPRIGEHVGWVEWYGQGLVIGAVCVAAWAVFRLRRPAAVPEARPGEPPILRRMPARLGRELLCLQMEDHYVRIHTPQGSQLVLMPLGQAMQAVGPLEGMRVHRSWWVARHAVEAVIEEGRNLRLRLVNGIEAPVSRPNVARLRAAGWLDAPA